MQMTNIHTYIINKLNKYVATYIYLNKYTCVHTSKYTKQNKTKIFFKNLNLNIYIFKFIYIFIYIF